MPAGIETFANQPTATVTSGGTTTGDTSFTVTGTDSWPAASASATPNTFFRITDAANTSEIMIVTSAAGGVPTSQSWTVLRGQEGTTAVAHAANWTAVQVITAGTLQNFKQSPAAATSAVTVNSATETLVATYTPTSDQLTAGTSWECVAYGSLQKLGGSLASVPVITWRLRWGWVSSASPGTQIASLATATNGPAWSVTTLAAGSSFDCNGTLTLIDATHAVGNLNFWFMNSATTVNSYVASSGSSTAISGSGPLALTCAITNPGTSQNLVSVAPMIYRAA